MAWMRIYHVAVLSVALSVTLSYGQETESLSPLSLSTSHDNEEVAPAEIVDVTSPAPQTESFHSAQEEAHLKRQNLDVAPSQEWNDKVKASAYKALDWLRGQRRADWGWGNHTHTVLLALQIANNTEKEPLLLPLSSLETQLSAKQMEVEILLLLGRHHETVPNPGQLARYSLALDALCQDPRRFHGHDLIAIIQHHEPQQDLEFALATLASCTSAAHVRKRQIRRLLDIAGSAADHNVDTIAMVILALRCIVTDHRHRHLQHFVRRPARGLARQQGLRGGFGGARTTALAMQALQDLDDDPACLWNRTAAERWLLELQSPEGAWGEGEGNEGGAWGLTGEVVLGLSSKGVASVRELQCGPNRAMEAHDNQVDLDGPKLAVPAGLTPNSEPDSEGRNVTFTYTLWVGSNITHARTLMLTSAHNTTFYHAMQMAADQDPGFAFEASEWPNGHYVHTLGGHKEEPRGYHYWLLYRLPEIPDPTHPPGNQLVAPVGVDDLIVEEGEHYLFWYKKL